MKNKIKIWITYLHDIGDEINIEYAKQEFKKEKPNAKILEICREPSIFLKIVKYAIKYEE